jgi:pimeloyl-ACP methyl ester carboxylesterase
MRTPDWLDTAAYPFAGRHFNTGEGRIHYVDEGRGAPVVIVHGTPTWSFEYRDLIRRLSATHRVIAPDHLGFGLSDRPADADYRPAAHARRLAALLESLDLRDVTLVVHDFGGPIGLSWALDHPERVARLVLLNTFAWPLADDPHIVRFAKPAAGPLGRFLYLRLNASPRWIVPSAFADRRRLTKELHRHYLAPFPDATSRIPLWTLARELLGSSDWYASLWARRERLRDVPALIVWGMKDPAFPPRYLARWREALPHARVVELAAVGHFPAEEAPEALGGAIEEFIPGGGVAKGRSSSTLTDSRK